MKFGKWSYITGERRTRANFVCFTKNWVKIGAFPNATPTSKIWKHSSVDQKDQRGRWVGQAHFSKIAQRKHKFMSTACLLKKIDAPYIAFTGKRTKTKREH